MEIDGLVWDPAVLEKIERKHHVMGAEVESFFFEEEPLVRRFERLYYAYGRTSEGRYLFVPFIYLGHKKARPITARDMTSQERRFFERER